MSISQVPGPAGGDRFLVVHAFWPLLAAGLLLSGFEFTGLDLWLADRWYALEGGRWALRQHWITADLLHEDARNLLLALGLCVILAALASMFWTPLHRWRRSLWCLAATLVTVPLVIGLLKHLSPVPCPWSLQRYGGELPYRHLFQQAPGTGGHCFPAGHASGGYALFGLYFAALPHVRRPALWLLPGLLSGLLLGLDQQLRGAHFLSHDVWTLFLSWFIALGLFTVIGRHRHPVGPDLEPVP